MFSSVLFPTDFSSHAKDELDCLTSFPHVAAIHLVHVVRPFPIHVVEKLVRDQSEEYLAAAKQYLLALNPSVAVTMQVAQGRDLAGTILAAAADAGADLVVLSGYATNFRAGILLGRVPPTVLCRTGSTDVLVMPNRVIDRFNGKEHSKFCRNIFTTILCPTDFAETSHKAIACAGAMPGVREIVLLHAGPEGAGAVPDAEARLEALRASLAGTKAKVRVRDEHGRPARTIARVAEEEDVSLVWMSVEGKGCLHAFLAGSIIEETLSLVKRPLMVIRSAG